MVNLPETETYETHVIKTGPSFIIVGFVAIKQLFTAKSL